MAELAESDIVDLNEVKNHIEKNGVSGIEKLVKQKLGRWKDVEINIGITGDSGTGKSSFINAIRGIFDDDDIAAKVGVTEKTTEPTPFYHPTNSKIKFWDLPGIGVPNYPDLKTYCKKVKLEKYDTFLIFTACRFTENNLKLAEKIRSVKKRFFFIRTKIDENKRGEEQKRSFDEESMLNEIRDDCSKNLVGLVEDSNNDIFLISNHDRTKWDFTRLTEAIIDVLPVRQRECLTLSLGVLMNHSTKILKRKIVFLKCRMWMIAMGSFAVGTVPVPGLSFAVDLALITAEISFYRSQLGLPEEDSERFQMLNVENKERVRKFCVTTATQVGSLFTTFFAEAAVGEVCQFIPFVGLGIAGSISFASTFLFLQKSLKLLEKTAMMVLDDLNID